MIENVGKALSRNKEFYKKFDKAKIIKLHIKKNNPICFDIGAFQGQSVEYFRSIFKDPIIYSFEPLKKNFEILKSKNYKHNMCFNMAISNFSEDTIFYENKIAHTSSLFKVNTKSEDSIKINELNKSKKEKSFSDYNKESKVQTTTLDKFYLTNNLSQIDLLKIDTQGAEVLVLEGGGKKFLKNTKLVMIEVLFFDYYESSNNLFDIEKHLIPLGFNLYSILDISQNPMNGRTDWVELLYVRD